MASTYLEPLQRCRGWTIQRLPAIEGAAVERSLGGSSTTLSQTSRDGKEAQDGVKITSKQANQIAAARSHIAALEKVPPQTPAVVFEDDFKFAGKAEDVLRRIDGAFKSTKVGGYDVIMLGDCSYREGQKGPAPDLRATKGAWCSEAYVVSPSYMPKLLGVVKDGLHQMETNVGSHVHAEVEPQGPAFDTLWYPLQQEEGSKWYVLRPKLGDQANTWGDSDIAGGGK
jgi:hypothetical protein